MLIMSVLAIVAIAGSSAASAGLITFEEVPGANLFVLTTPLTEEYAYLGVHFIPPGGITRGSVVWDYTWSIPAHSGRNFLAFNSGAASDNHAEGIVFDQLMSEVSIFAAGYNQPDTFRVTAFWHNFSVIDVLTLTTQNWTELSVSNPLGIRKIVLENLTDGLFVYDDLSFTPVSNNAVPEPASLVIWGILAHWD